MAPDATRTRKRDHLQWPGQVRGESSSMASDRYQQAAQLFQEALDLPPEKRHEHVQRAAGEDRDLAARVQRMLAWSDRESATDAFIPEGSPGHIAPSDRAAVAADAHARLIGAT